MQDGGTHGVAGELRTAGTTWAAVKMAAHMEWLERTTETTWAAVKMAEHMEWLES